MLEQLTARLPAEVEVWFALGRAHGMLDQDRQAEAAFRRAAQLRPDLRDAHLDKLDPQGEKARPLVNT